MLCKGVTIPDLMMLQRAHDQLLEIATAEVEKVLNKPVADAMKDRKIGEEMVKVSIPFPQRVYHGTNSVAVARILKEGITPRGDRKPNHPKMPSRPDCVYLTDTYALAYLRESLELEDESYGAVVEIDLGDLLPPGPLLSDALLSNLVPDEDAVCNGENPQTIDIEKLVVDEKAFFINVIMRSLFAYGTVAHRGTIPASAVRRVAYIPRGSLLSMVMTRWKTKLNWGAIRAQQQAILQWVFDGGDQPFPVPPEEVIFERSMCEELADIATGGVNPASVIAAGVHACTLWRAYLMKNPEMFNRKGIRVVSTKSTRSVNDACVACEIGH